MSVTITVRLSDREADALMDVEDRSGWHSRPSRALQSADQKIRSGIPRQRTEPEGNTTNE